MAQLALAPSPEFTQPLGLAFGNESLAHLNCADWRVKECTDLLLSEQWKLLTSPSRAPDPQPRLPSPPQNAKTWTADAQR